MGRQQYQLIPVQFIRFAVIFQIAVARQDTEDFTVDGGGAALHGKKRRQRVDNTGTVYPIQQGLFIGLEGGNVVIVVKITVAITEEHVGIRSISNHFHGRTSHLLYSSYWYYIIKIASREEREAPL